MNKYIIFTVVAILSLSVSCKKKNESNSTCPSQLYGNSIYSNPSSGLKSDIGILDLPNKKFAGYATMPFLNSDRQSCFNSDDNCYYMFQTYTINYTRSYSTLYKIDGSGSITGIKAVDSLDSFQYNSLIYNQNRHKFYCIRNNKIGEISVNGSSFSTKDITGPIHSFIQNSASIAVDNTTGDMYYITADASNSTGGFFIEKYNPGNSQPAVVSGINTVYAEKYHLWDVCYNKNDKMLYAVKYPEGISPATVMKIDQASGTMKELYFLGYLDTYFSSACIDPCNNRYILSVGTSYNANSFLFKFDLSSNMVTKDTLTGAFVQGLNFR